MKLLKNRPFAALCLIFITVSLLIHTTEPKIKIFLALALSVCLSGVLFIKRPSPKGIFLSLCILFAILAIASQLIGIDLRRKTAVSYEGERRALMLVTATDSATKTSNEYSVDIREIDGKRVSFSTTLSTDSALTLDVGDLIYTDTELSIATKENAFIEATIYEDYTCVVISKNTPSLKVFFSNLRSSLSEYMDATLGDSLSAIARGFLLSDKSDMPSDVIKDFRRAGVSHLLAVSGFHISIIIAFAEFILCALYIPKKARAIILAVISLSFLAMTGFALSACRAVIMLLSVYFAFLFLQEHDSPSALFSSVSIIILLSPSSVTDVGLWLSFLATLGIIAVYSPLSARFNKRERRSARGFLRSFLKKLLLAVFLTFICNIFICIIIWLVFGEISLVSLLSNPLLAPLSTLFVILVPIATALAKLPVIGTLMLAVLSDIARLILSLCEFFSDISGAMLSLRYPFAPFIIIPMTVTLAVMLLIELKKKWAILLPMLASCALFALCLLGYNILRANEIDVSYFSENNSEAIIVTKGHSASICDLSYAPSSFLNTLPELCSSKMATEISEYTITHYHNKHPYFLDRLFAENLVNALYLPYPSSDDEREIASEILLCAADADVNVYLYSDGERLPMLDGSYLTVMRTETDGKHPSICAVVGYRESVLTYLNSDLSKTTLIDNTTRNSDHIIFGRHGANFSETVNFKTDPQTLKSVFFADSNVYARSELDIGDAKLCLSPKDEKNLLFELVLD